MLCGTLEEEEEGKTVALYISPADRYPGPVIGGLPSDEIHVMGRL